MAEVQFLFDNQLIATLENLIKESRNKLFLVSPFIDLDKRIQDALNEKRSKHNFELKVLFGKNENNIYKSIKKDSLDFLKTFPNIEIRYNERLHAKFYLNDFDFITTSLNLYDYSLAKNIEVGIICNYGSKGMVGKVLNETDNFISQGVDKLKHDIFGMGKDLNPIEKFETIFENSEIKYKTEPVLVDSGGIKGFVFGSKKLDHFVVKVDNFEINKAETKPEVSGINAQNKGARTEENKSPTTNKFQSASQLSKSFGVTQPEISNLMEKFGLIEGETITSKGIAKGIIKKNYMGRDYIAYPENLEELNSLKK